MGKLLEASWELPDPEKATSLNEIVGLLRQLKVWAGDPSYESIKDQVNAAWAAAGRPATVFVGKSTVADCFRTGRQRLNADLVVAVVAVLVPDDEYVAGWRLALRLIGERVEAARRVRVREQLPQDLSGFVGRTEELGRIEDAVRRGQRVVTISGMAGVGKSSLAVQAGHLLAQRVGFDRVFFANLRGFHPDPAQPAVDPAAVLESFLELLGVPAEQIPLELKERVEVFRQRLDMLRVLVVLDDAADEEQMRPLLARAPGCLTLVTSRRSLDGGPGTTEVAVDVFSAQQAEDFLGEAVGVATSGADAEVLGRIARRCGYLPLALGLVARYISWHPDWTLTDHADRLDRRYADLRLDSAVALAFDVSYLHLPAAEQRLLRLLALHPGQDFDAFIAAAVTGSELDSVRGHLHRLSRDNLVQAVAPGRFTFHDLVRAHAIGRAEDEESPSAQRVALTQLFDFYLAAAATAMDSLYPTESDARPEVRRTGIFVPTAADAAAARAWLMTERFAFVAISAYTAMNGWPRHATRLSSILFRYLGYGCNSDALAIHGWACDAAEQLDDPVAYARALIELGKAHARAGHLQEAAGRFERALRLFDQLGDLNGQIRALGSLSLTESGLGRYQSAVGYLEHVLVLSRQIGDHVAEAKALIYLSQNEVQLGRYQAAGDRLRTLLETYVRDGDRLNEALARLLLGEIDTRQGRLSPAAVQLDQALYLFQELASRDFEGRARQWRGVVHARLGEHERATQLHQEALEIFLDVGAPSAEADARNGLGDVARASGRPQEAVIHHTAALLVATENDYLYGQAAALAGLGGDHQALGDLDSAIRHYHGAQELFRELEVPEVGDIQQRLASLT